MQDALFYEMIGVGSTFAGDDERSMCLGAAEGFKILPIEGLGDGNNRAEICIPATFGLGIRRRRKVFENVDTMYHNREGTGA